MLKALWAFRGGGRRQPVRWSAAGITAECFDQTFPCPMLIVDGSGYFVP